MNDTRTVVGILGVWAAAALDFAANWLAAHYLVPIGPFLIPGGTFVFAFSFVLYDYLRRLYGARHAAAAIILGFLASVTYAAAFGGGTGRIAVAGLVALACSSTLDFLVQTVTLRRSLWQYVLASNCISLVVDSAVFTAIAFAVSPLSVRLNIFEGQYLAKVVVTVAAVPLVYWARRQTPREVAA